MSNSDAKPDIVTAPPGARSVVTSHERPGQRPTERPRPTLTGLHAAGMTPTPIAMAKLGRYQVVSRIATGGMAEVYLALHGELAGFRTPVVVKKVLPHLACNQQFIDMFLDEARIASLLDHPNVVRIYEVGRAGTEFFLAMELVQGRPLSALARKIAEIKQPLDPRLAAYIVAQAAQGLHHAHGMTDPLGNLLGLVHRDISPQNIMVSYEGSVKVIDFGIARAMGRITDTNTGSMKGKFGYMSPEQAKGEEVDKRTDIFALGVVLWEAVCGKRLFQRDNELATMRALIYDPIAKPSAVTAVDPALDAIIMKALSRNPNHRYATAADLAAALEKFIAKEGGVGTAQLAGMMKTAFASELSLWQQTIRAALAMPSEPDVTPTLPPPSVTTTTTLASVTNVGAPPTVRWPVYALLAVTVVAVALLVVLLARPSQPQFSTPPPAPPPAPVAQPRIEQLAPAQVPVLALPPGPALAPKFRTPSLSKRKNPGIPVAPEHRPSPNDKTKRPNPF